MLANKIAKVLLLNCLHLLEKKNTLHVTYEVNCVHKKSSFPGVFDKKTKFLIIILENQFLSLH